MISLARKNLWSDKIKLAASIGGVGLSILVILAPFGVYFGSLRPAEALPLNSGADLWIIQQGSADMFHTNSVLPNGYEAKLGDLPSVDSAGSVINYATQIEIDSQKVTTRVFGFDKKNGFGAPWKIYRGKSDIESGEVVVDRSLAHQYQLSLGDKITIGDENFKIAGISLETNVLVFQYIFILKDDAARVFKQSEVVNYYLVRAKEGNEDEAQKALTGVVPGSAIKSKTEIAKSNSSVIKDSFLPILSIIAAVGFFVGIAVIGITIYSATIERSREYGVLKAIGIKARRLYQIVLAQSVITSLAGFALGVIAYLLMVRLVFTLTPSVNFYLSFAYYVYVFFAALAMSIISSLPPIHKVNTIDPAITFKA